jgi:transposase InsO family protein
VLDSGCTQYMTGDPMMFSSVDENMVGYSDIIFGDNSRGKVKGVGTISISSDHSLSKVLFVDSLKFNLLAVTQLCDFGYKCSFTKDDVVVTSLDGKDNIFTGFRYEDVYLTDFATKEANLSTCLFTQSSLGWLWHRRLGHVGMKQLNRLIKHDLVVGLKNVKFEKDKLCSACQAGKQVANAHPTKSVMSTERPLELLHIDLFSPTTYRSIGGNCYYLVVVDDTQDILRFFFLHDKADTYDTFKKFLTRAENEFELKVKKVRSDNGSEFRNTRVEEWCDEKGIKHEFSTKYTPKQNGLVERKNRTLIDMARSMLSEYNVSDSFWAEAINMACHASNRLYCHRFHNKTPYELLIGRKPNISYFRVFGCKCYILKKGTRLSKFQNKCDEDFLLGYSSCSKSYRVYNKTHGIVEEAFDVEFNETNGSHNEQENLDDVRSDGLRNAMKNMSIGDVRPREEDEDDDGRSISIRVNPSTSISNDQAQQIVQDSGNDDSQVQDRVGSSSTISPSTQEPIVPQRTHHILAKDHLVDQIMADISKGVQTRSRIASFCEYYSFISFLEPNRVDDALRDPDWVNAMHEELNNFTQNQVWDLVERPKNYNVIGTKWVFRNKQNEDGLVVRNKARLVAQGFTQVVGLDFGETFSPVARLEAIRILLAYACSDNIKLFQMDVKSIFLNGKISELIFVKQPSGFEDPKKANHVYKLSKALYGLKQAPRAWYERLRDFLISK